LPIETGNFLQAQALTAEMPAAQHPDPSTFARPPTQVAAKISNINEALSQKQKQELRVNTGKHSGS
jgi:hypothetical protein